LANHLTIERLGGFAGFGGPSARIRSRGAVDLDQLSSDDRATVDALFAKRRNASPASGSMPDAFRYRISRGGETVEVPEGVLPSAITAAIVDELA